MKNVMLLGKFIIEKRDEGYNKLFIDPVIFFLYTTNGSE
jgi:hypothetical protein